MPYDTDPLDSDTDNDKLSDGFEVELWFDPINYNADGDSFSDYEEWINNTSPFVYNMTFQEGKKEFLEGALLGDWVTADSIEKLLGQIAFSFVPFVADARDYFANIFVNLDSWAALANVGGFILDLTPAGAAGDAAKALSKLEKFVVKHADDVPKVLEAITQAAKIFPKADEVIPGLVKILPVGSIDNIAKSVKNGERITKSDYKQLQNLVEAAGKNFDEVIGNGGLILKGNYSEEYVQKLIDTYKKFQERGYKIGEHGLNRIMGRINQGKINSLDEVFDVLETGTRYVNTVNGGTVIFKNSISIHLTDDGFIKTVVGNAHIKPTWEMIE